MRGVRTGIGQSPQVRGSATVGAWTLVSRITGAGRVIVIGAVLGPTYFANTFVATNSVPNLIYISILGSVLGPVVVPAIVRTTTEAGTRGATELLGRLAGFLLLVMGLASVALLVGSPLIARLLTVGIADDSARQRGEYIALVMLLFVAPQVLLYIIAALGAAAQQAKGRFALAAAAPAVENIGVMVTVAVGVTLYPPGVEIDHVAVGFAILLCIGSTLSVALHMALQLFGAARAGLPIRPRWWRRSDPLTGEITARMRRSLVIAACPEATHFTLIAAAATVAGGVLILQIALAVYATLVALGARSVATAMLPGLSRAAHENHQKVFGDSVRQSIAYTLIISVPALLLVGCFASPIADILANGELRVGDLIGALAACIAVLAVAQVAAGLYEVGRQTLFARLDIRGPRAAALLGFGVTLTSVVFALLSFEGTDLLVGLAVAVLAGDVVAATTVGCLLRRALRPGILIDRRLLGAAARSSIAILPVVAAGGVLLGMDHFGRWGALVIVGLISALALSVYGTVLHAYTRCPEAAR